MPNMPMTCSSHAKGKSGTSDASRTARLTVIRKIGTVQLGDGFAPDGSLHRRQKVIHCRTKIIRSCRHQRQSPTEASKSRAAEEVAHRGESADETTKPPPRKAAARQARLSAVAGWCSVYLEGLPCRRSSLAGVHRCHQLGGASTCFSGFSNEACQHRMITVPLAGVPVAKCLLKVPTVIAAAVA